MPDALRDLDRQIANAPFPAHALEHQREAFGLASGHDAVISSLVGRVALPAAYLGARRAAAVPAVGVPVAAPADAGASRVVSR